MKVLFFSEYFPESRDTDITGGIEARCYNITKHLAKNNEVTVITSWKKGLKRKEKIDKVSIIRVGHHHRYSNSAGFLSRFLFAIAAIKEGIKHKPDIISGENFTSYYPAYYTAKKLKKACAATYHETWIGEWIKNKGVTGIPYDIYERLLLRLKYDKIISVSEFTKKRLIEKGAEQKRISVVNNGINLEDFNFASKKEKTPTICFIGRLIKTKKADVLVKAVAVVKKDIPEIRCKIIGRGKEEKRLKKLAFNLGLEHNINFLGLVKETKEVKKILHSSTVFCQPSIVEGFGIVLLEAMASGTPYVCSDIKVFKEVTENGKGGLLFKKEDEEDLAKKVLLLLRNKKIYRKKIEEGRKLIKSYLWKNLADSVGNIYKEVIDNYK